MKYPIPCIEGILVARYKRFFAEVRLPGGEVVVAHCPNTGRMTGHKTPGMAARISPATNPNRKLAWTLEQVHDGNAWVGVNTSRANAVVREAIEVGRIAPLAGYGRIRAEQRYAGNCRIDLLLDQHPERSGECCWVEVKNTTMAEGDLSRFPDAVTTRGTKHLQALAGQAAKGDRAVVLFSVQRGDCTRFSPADAVDPAYGRALRVAMQAGVEAYAYACALTAEEVVLVGALPVEIPDDPLCAGGGG